MFGLKTSRKNVIQTNLTKRFPQERGLKVGKMGPPLHKQQMSESKGRDWIEVTCDVILSPKLTTISLQLLLACYCGVVSSVFFVHFFERQIWFKTVEQKHILDGNGTAFILYDEDLEPNAKEKRPPHSRKARFLKKIVIWSSKDRDRLFTKLRVELS